MGFTTQSYTEAIRVYEAEMANCGQKRYKELKRIVEGLKKVQAERGL